MKTVTKQVIASARQLDDLAAISDVQDIIADIRNGKMVILVDDEDRENEGDLVMAAQMVTPEHINFMATHGRGLICLAMESAMINRLNLPPMAARNNAPLSTAFTVSIEARTGVTTGISAPDRARTIQVAIDPNSTSADLVTPGHIFPLQAQGGGVLVRTGHTEAAVDLAHLAGLRAAGVICEIMRDDGEMARLPDLIAFAQQHGIKLGTIADLVSYRLAQDCLIERRTSQTIDSQFGGAWQEHTYQDKLHNRSVTVLVKGNPDYTKPVLVRMHTVSEQADILGVGNSKLQLAMLQISSAGAGIIVMLKNAEEGVEPDTRDTLRRTGIGAQILRDLHVKQMILLTSNPKHVIGLQGFGLDIVEQRLLETE